MGGEFRHGGRARQALGLMANRKNYNKESKTIVYGIKYIQRKLFFIFLKRPHRVSSIFV